MTNAGTGKLTFAITTLSPTITTLRFRARRRAFHHHVHRWSLAGSPAIRACPGTNLVSSTTTGVTLSGQSLDIQLASPEAVNVTPPIRVYMNYRQSDQRGIIFPSR